MHDWDRTAGAGLATCPLIRWESAIAPMFAVIRLLYAQNEDQFQSGGIALQLTMTAVQARQLSQDLARIADRLDADNLPRGTVQ